jgi:hypothetical protein
VTAIANVSEEPFKYEEPPKFWAFSVPKYNVLLISMLIITSFLPTTYSAVPGKGDQTNIQKSISQ